MRSEKQQSRDTAKARRLHMSGRETMDKSAQIITCLIDIIDWGSVRAIHSYVANESMHEPLTLPFSEHAWQQGGTYVYVPRIAGQTMESVKVTQATIFKLNRYRIPEPQGNVNEPDVLDIIIVPTLAFDSDCNRLGYGKGYYDRFLRQHPAALKIGLAYEEDRAENLPAALHDVQLDAVITDQAVYHST